MGISFSKTLPFNSLPLEKKGRKCILSLRPETKKRKWFLTKKWYFILPKFLPGDRKPLSCEDEKNIEIKKEMIFQTISVITESRTRPKKKYSFHLSSYQSLSSVKVSCLNQFFVIETHRQKLSKIFEISQRGQKCTQLK